ncbi:MAG TPA: EAL domain-containing protein [Rhodanobacteraceae bacterium]
MYQSHTKTGTPLAPAGSHDALRRAILTSELAYQPQAGLQRLAYGATVGYEALLRLAGADPAPAPLLDAIAVLPDSAQLACHRMLLERVVPLALHTRALTGRPVAVNIPVCVLEDRAARIWLATHACGLTLEILETGNVRDWPGVARTLRVLRAHGSRIAIDDYGAGHWNASTLAQLPTVDVVKLDRALLRTRKGRAALPYLVSAIHAWGAEALIEGVESEADHVTVLTSGADAGQGYWYGLPCTVPLDAFTPVPGRPLARVA